MTLRAVLFDMGGVLLDMGNDAGMPVGRLDFRGREALATLLRARGARLALDDLERLLFAPFRAEYEKRYERQREALWKPHLSRLRRALHVRLADATLLTAWFGPYAETVAAAPDASGILTRLAADGLRLGLVSNVPLPGAHYERLLARAGLLALLPVRQFSYEAGSRKPSPAMVRTALTALGVDPSEALFVGDRRAVDVVAGRAAGTRTAWLRSAATDGPSADVEIASLSDLPRALAR